MNARRDVYAVVPIKDTNDAKRRLAGVLGAPRRRELALAMFEDVLATLSRVRELAGIVVVTAGPAAAAIARRYGARVSRQGAHDGHSGAVAAAKMPSPCVATLTLLIGRWGVTLPVPLRFGTDSFFPHLAAAKRQGIEPTVLKLPRIALDIDTPDDLALFLATPSHTRARAMLETWRLRLTGETCNEARCQ